MEYFLLAVLLVSVPIAQAAEEANNKILDHLLEKCMNNSTPLNIPCVSEAKVKALSGTEEKCLQLLDDEKYMILVVKFDDLEFPKNRILNHVKISSLLLDKLTFIPLNQLERKHKIVIRIEREYFFENYYETNKEHLILNFTTPGNKTVLGNFKADEYSRVLVPDGMKICLDFSAYHIRKHLSTLPKQIRKSFCQSKDWTGHVTEREERYDLLGTSHISIYKNELEFEACLPRYCFNVKTNALKWVEHPIEDSLKKIPANEAMKAVSPPILTFLILFHLIKTMTI